MKRNLEQKCLEKSLRKIKMARYESRHWEEDKFGSQDNPDNSGKGPANLERKERFNEAVMRCNVKYFFPGTM